MIHIADLIIEGIFEFFIKIIKIVFKIIIKLFNFIKKKIIYIYCNVSFIAKDNIDDRKSY